MAVGAAVGTDKAAGGGQRLAFLDALRGVAACAVIAHHIGLALKLEYIARFDFGYFGVVLFFLCSGFIIPTSLVRAGTLGRFWRGRFFRLYPLYWGSLLGALTLAAGGFLSLSGAFLRSPFLAALANATMFQTFVGLPDAIVVYWSLAYELVFYLLVSGLFVAGLLRRAVFVAGGLLLGAGLVGALLPHAPSVQGDTDLSTTIFFLATMFVGAVIAGAVAGEVSRATAGGVFALALATIIVACGARLGSDETGHARQYLTAGFAAYAIFGGALLLRRRRFPRPLTGAGTISYSLYLIHPLVLGAVPRAGNGAATALLWIVVVLAVSLATYRWIELPFMALGRRARRAGRSIPLPGSPPLPARLQPERAGNAEAAEIA